MTGEIPEGMRDVGLGSLRPDRTPVREEVLSECALTERRSAGSVLPYEEWPVRPGAAANERDQGVRP